MASPALTCCSSPPRGPPSRSPRATGLGAAGRSVASVALDIAGRDGELGGCAGARRRHRGLRPGGRRRAARPRLRRAGRVLAQRPGRGVRGPARRRPMDLDGAARRRWSPPTWWSRCSGTARRVLTEDRARPPRSRGGTRPLPVIDLALRSDVLSAARSVPGVRVIDLHTVAEQADPTHRDALAAAQDIVIDGGRGRSRSGWPGAHGPGGCRAAPTHLGRGGEGDGPAPGASTRPTSPPTSSWRCTGSRSRCCTPRRCGPRRSRGPATAPATCRRCTRCSASTSPTRSPRRTDRADVRPDAGLRVSRPRPPG